jgi:hypothetical protein
MVDVEEKVVHKRTQNERFIYGRYCPYPKKKPDGSDGSDLIEPYQGATNSTPYEEIVKIMLPRQQML